MVTCTRRHERLSGTTTLGTENTDRLVLLSNLELPPLHEEFASGPFSNSHKTYHRLPASHRRRRHNIPKSRQSFNGTVGFLEGPVRQCRRGAGVETGAHGMKPRLPISKPQTSQPLDRKTLHLPGVPSLLSSSETIISMISDSNSAEAQNFNPRLHGLHLKTSALAIRL